MAFTATTVWELRSAGSDSNGGGFDTGVSGMATDLAATSATGNSPVVTSASYNFVAGDVNAWVYIKAGTNWTPGWYQIASVAANAATLSAAIGAAVLANGSPTTAAGCATTGSPTAGTWSIDYSQQTGVKLALTDMIIDATTNTKATSVLNPLTVNMIGNIFNVTSGTGWTVQRVALVSISVVTGTFDKALGTTSSTGGHANMGGALATPGQAGAIAIGGNTIWTPGNSYTTTSATNNVAAGCPSFAAGAIATLTRFMAYGTVRGDRGAQATITASGISSFTMVTMSPGGHVEGIICDCANLTTGRAFNVSNSRAYRCVAKNCKNGAFIGAFTFLCEATGCSAVVAFSNTTAINCVAHDNTFTGFQVTNALWCISCNNTGAASDGFSNSGANGTWINCTSYANGRHGYTVTATSGIFVQATSCIAVNNGGWGYNASAAFDMLVFNCAGYNNTSGLVTTNLVGLSIMGLITLTGDPFVAAGSNNFALNNTAGAGASCRAAGTPGTVTASLLPGISTNGYNDLGAAQHQDSASGGLLMPLGMMGGLRG